MGRAEWEQDRSRRAAGLRRLAPLSLALLAAAAVWLPSVHLLFRPRPSELFSDAGLSRTPRALAAHHLSLWRDPAQRAHEIDKMRAANAEWDFMARTFFVLSLANIGLRDAARTDECLSVMDLIIEETLRLERERGIYHFLMPYARRGAWVASTRRSLFQDGEIGMMLAARRLVREREELKPLLSERVRLMAAQMEESPVLSGESYPDECWTFCNSIALATMRAADVLDHTDHAELRRRWVATARAKLVDVKTGMLISSYSFDGEPKDGPEGSSIWTAAHFLRLTDPELAEEQYRKAKRELAGCVLGLGYAREWPASWVGPADIDSGPIVPGLEISLGSSGQALLGATTFGDRDYAVQLMTSLNLAGFPVERNGTLRYAASNAVGDAVVLYALVQGPLWRELERKGEVAE